MKISIIGSGWVGTAVGKGLRDLGNDVIFYDIVDKDLPNFTKDLDYAIQNSDVSFICVPTPTTNEGIDLKCIKDAAKDIGIALRSKDSYHLVVVKSTVTPGTTQFRILAELDVYSNRGISEERIGLCMNPEFLTEIDGSWTDDKEYKTDFISEETIIIGELTKKAGNILEEVYKPLEKTVFRTNLKTAEMIKYASNCMLATKISYWNEIFMICNKIGVDSKTIADILGRTPKIGKYGTVHGKAFGGSCLPKDLKALIQFARTNHYDAKLLKAVDSINEEIGQERGVRE